MRAARTATDIGQRWAHLERAHILSQPDPWLHTGNHIAMCALAIGRRDGREALGQVVRTVVAAPGSPAGRYPEAIPAVPVSACSSRCRSHRTWHPC